MDLRTSSEDDRKDEGLNRGGLNRTDGDDLTGKVSPLDR